jgi:hypothetical protein
MNQYPVTESVLAAQFNAMVGYSEESGIAAFRADLDTDPEYRNAIAAELRRAFADENLSWCELFLAHDTGDFESDEAEARRFAARILWEPVFGKGVPLPEVVPPTTR